MPDQNDIEYSIDVFRLIQTLFSRADSSGQISADPIGSATDFINRIITMAIDIWQLLMVLGIFLSLLLIFGIIYTYMRAARLSEIEAEWLRNNELLYDEMYRKSDSQNRRWRDVEKHIESDKPNDWKLAIIEADIMLGELLETAGFAGMTIGEQLKSASPTAFQNINQAWRAHQVRNQIAHEGSDFVLTKKLAKETIAQYSMVFKEFGLI